MNRVNKVEFEKLDKMLADIREKIEDTNDQAKQKHIAEMKVKARQLSIDDLFDVEYQEGEEE